MRQLSLITLLIFLASLTGYFFYQTVELKKQNKFGIQVQQYLIDSVSSVQRNFGKSLVKTHCQACHKFNATDNILSGVVQRVGEDYLGAFITNQDSLVGVKNEYAILLKSNFGNLGNSHNFKFSKAEMSAIIEFLR